MSLAFAFVVIAIADVYVFKDFFEVIIFLYFYIDLDINAAPIFPYCPKNICRPKEPLLLSMTPTAFLTMMFSFPSLRESLDLSEAAAIVVLHCHLLQSFPISFACSDHE